MTRIVALLFAISVLISGCSSDDHSSAAIESAMTLDNMELLFDTAWRSMELGEEGERIKFTLYYVEATCGVCGTPPAYQQLDLIFMPPSVNEFVGTYDVSLSSGPGLISGNFTSRSFPINFREGSVTISKKSGGRYKIVLNDVTGTFWQDPSRLYHFGGYFEGNFPTKEQ